VAVAPRPSALGSDALDRRMLILGDSIMLGAHEELVARLGASGWQVTPVLAESLHTYDAPALVDEHRDAVGDVVVVGLGTNDGATPEQLGGWIDGLMDRLRGVARVYWVNLPPFADWVPAANAEIAAAQDRWGRLRVIDWHARAAGDPALRYPDGIHLTVAGRAAMAELVGTTVDGTATETPTTAPPAPVTSAPATAATTVPVTAPSTRALTIPPDGRGGESTAALVVLGAAGAVGAGALAIVWARAPRGRPAPRGPARRGPAAPRVRPVPQRRPAPRARRGARVPSARASRVADRRGVGLDRSGVRERPRHRR
jgi:hypothetical protein